MIQCPVDQTPFETKAPKKMLIDVGPLGRWFIFAGVSMAILGLLLVTTLRNGLNQISATFGEKAMPYILCYVPLAIMIGGHILYGYFPKRLVIPFGIAGWMVGMALIYWYFWFGPAAFGHR